MGESRNTWGNQLASHPRVYSGRLKEAWKVCSKLAFALSENYAEDKREPKGPAGPAAVREAQEQMNGGTNSSATFFSLGDRLGCFRCLLWFLLRRTSFHRRSLQAEVLL